MKFARYLEETQTPEWKRAYIDYRGLKKRITAVRRAQDESLTQPGHAMPLARSSCSSAGSRPRSVHSEAYGESTSHVNTRDTTQQSIVGRSGTLEDEPASPTPLKIINIASTSTSVLPRLRRRSTAFSTMRMQVPPSPQELPLKLSENEHAQANLDCVQASSIHVNEVGTEQVMMTPTWAPGSHPPLHELLPLLTPVQRAFFDMLDGELDKVESFFCAKERELSARYQAVKKQLEELKGHRRAFHEAHPSPTATYAWLPFNFAITLPPAISRLRQHVHGPIPKPHLPSLHLGKRSNSSDERMPDEVDNAAEEEKTIGEHDDLGTDAIPMKRLDPADEKRLSTEPVARAPDGEGMSNLGKPRANQESQRPRARFRVNEGGRKGSGHKTFSGEDNNGTTGSGVSTRHDPEEYHEAKKKLRKAVLECYRGLEVLSNYRMLNLIGFRKALKKFEKVTHIPAQQAYTIEKIEPSAFASGARLDAMLREMEELFAARFARGDKKKAQARLRGGAQLKSHHYSTFRTGMMIGLGLPALIDGLVKSFQPETRAAIPSWDGLLFVYGVFFVPILFCFLIGLNLLVWHNARINYVFIFELDPRTRLDHREYFELPALLLSTLCYSFWLSFSRIGTHAVSPSDWPLLWLAWALFIWLNPLPIFFRSSRYWLLKNLYRQLTSGVRRVEFQDFWMGDQFCSLVFTLGDLWFVGCAYSHALKNWRVCTTGANWAPMFAIAVLPFFVRFVQSIRRWADSRQLMHLVNAGKYGTGIIYYLTYYLWRQHGGGRGPRFVAWCVLGVFYAGYAGAWDILMDWSLMQRHAKYRFLRSELIYTSHIPLYYVAIVTNIIIRYEFLMYIPEKGVNYVIRTFIAAMLEMLRRWQWNFLRLENEHIGNMDQYRVTREVPLPYSFDNQSHDSDGGDEDDEVERTSISTRSWHRRKVNTSSVGAVEVEDNHEQ